MQTVYLNGGIAQFGTKWSTNCANIRDVFKLIECQTPGFRKYLIDAAENNVGFEIQRGEEFLERDEELLLSLRSEDIIITEVPAGAKDGASKILTAIAILVYIGMTGDVTGGGGFWAEIGAAVTGKAGVGANIAAFVAVNLALQGVTQLLAPGPESDESEENRAYLFDGPITSPPEGMAVPVLYGELIVGGLPVSVNYRSNSAFSQLNDIDVADTYVNFITGDPNTNTPVAMETDTAAGILPTNEPEGEVFPDARDTEYDARNDAADSIEVSIPDGSMYGVEYEVGEADE